MRKKLTQEYLKECLTYDPETGIFTWNIRPLSHFKKESIYKAWNTNYSRKEAGNINSDSGYRQIRIDNKKLYMAHRLAFLYMEGYFPENEVDHMDRVRSNNKWDNLREVSSKCNHQNCSLAKNNNSGICGVYWHKGRGKWRSYIVFSNKQVNLGYFVDFNDAVMARYNEELTNPLWSCSIESTAYAYLRDNNLLEDFAKRDFTRNNLSSRNKSGVCGVGWDKEKNKFISQIKVIKKHIFLGYFKKFEDAVMARYQEEVNNPNWQFSENSSAYKYLKDHNLI